MISIAPNMPLAAAPFADHGECHWRRGDDDRINNTDCAAPAAIYCSSGEIHIYSVNRRGRGRLAFVVTNEQINALGIPTSDTLIAAGRGLGVYRQSNGLFRLEGPKSPGEARSSSLSEPVRVPVTTTSTTTTSTTANRTYTVRRGDNLFRLSLRFNTTVAAIAAANAEITNVRLIFAGQRIIIPGGTVASGGQTTVSRPPRPLQHREGYSFAWSGC